TQRSLDRIRILVSQTGANVKCAGRYVGLLNGDGKTDQRVEDLAILRAIPDLIVTTPGDAAETREVVRDATAHDGPVYLRLLRDAVAELGLDELPGPDHLTQLRENTDLTVCRPAHRRHTLTPRPTCCQRPGPHTVLSHSRKRPCSRRSARTTIRRAVPARTTSSSAHDSRCDVIAPSPSARRSTAFRPRLRRPGRSRAQRPLGPSARGRDPLRWVQVPSTSAGQSTSDSHNVDMQSIAWKGGNTR